MNILLIAPSVKGSLSNGLDDGMPKNASRHFGVYPHLGICYIAATLRAAGIGVSLLDLNVEPLTREGLVERVVASKADLVGISCMTFTFLHALEIARVIKERCPRPVVLGGPHVSLYPEETLVHDCVDLVVIGEGERTMLEVAEAFASGNPHKRFPGIDGIAFRDGKNVVVTKARALVAELDSLLPPAVDLLPRGTYYGCNLAYPYFTVMTSRGCPYDCSFCSKAPWGRSCRFHSPQRVLDELEYLVRERGIRAIDFFDDTFTADRKRTQAILSGIRERGLQFEFGITTRVNTVDPEILAALKEAGCRTVAYGVESGDPAVLQAINKHITLDQVREAFRLTAAAGMNSVGFFLVGNPGESEENIKNTIRFIKEIEPDYFIANVLIPYPGSPLYRSLLESGLMKEDYWRRVTLEGKPLPTPVASELVPLERLIRFRNRINRMPYLRWRTNLVKFGKLRSVHDLLRSFHTLKSAIFGRKL